MSEEDTVKPQNAFQAIEAIEPIEQQADESMHEEKEVQTQVPLSALQKERRKRQELELELEWERKRANNQPKQQQEEDNSEYESATRADLSKSQQEIVRIVEEKSWIKSNPEKYEKLNEYLPSFLKQRPNLAHAINTSSNRYEEAYILMEALTTREQKQLKAPPLHKREAPGSPGSVPKAASLNQAVDVMTMSDTEFNQYRQSLKKGR